MRVHARKVRTSARLARAHARTPASYPSEGNSALNYTFTPSIIDEPPYQIVNNAFEGRAPYPSNLSCAYNYVSFLIFPSHPVMLPESRQSSTFGSGKLRSTARR